MLVLDRLEFKFICPVGIESGLGQVELHPPEFQ